MYLSHLSLVNFKNIEQEEFTFIPGVNLLLGLNGQGKTNVLDAIHYLSLCRSYFNPIDSQNIRHEEPFFVIQGAFSDGTSDTEVYCGQKRGQRKIFRRNKKEYERLSDHIGIFPLVMITPADSSLILEGSEVRRKFIDSIISQYDKQYLEHLIHYVKVLEQRNALLKKMVNDKGGNYELLEVFNTQLNGFASLIHERRTRFMEGFIPVFRKYYSMIGSPEEEVGLLYESQLHESSMEECLAKSFERDRIMQYTTVGIHKDDLAFTLNGFPVKKFGSQGQQKSFLIALKLAQHEYVGKLKGFAPVLLLDDIFDKLDNERVNLLMDLVTGDGFGQVFITDTDIRIIPEIFEQRKVPFTTFTLSTGKVCA
ncbi:MAG: DNA replication/repair protein RecF [Flavobacteriales bacterium]